MKKPDPVIKTLRKVPGLRGQSDRALAALAPLVDEVDIAAGERLTREGIGAKEAFIVVEGDADVFVDGEAIATIGAGDFVGEIAMLDLGPALQPSGPGRRCGSSSSARKPSGPSSSTAALPVRWRHS